MARQRTAQNEPDANVPNLKAIWEGLGANVVVVSNGDGTSNVTATWPDPAPGAAAAAGKGGS